MNPLSLEPNIITADQKQFDLEFDRLNSQVKQLFAKTSFELYTSFEQLGLDSNLTLTDIALKLPLNSVLRFDAIQGSQTNLELPINPDGDRSSGQLIAANHGRNDKVYFYWQNEFAAAHTTYNTFVTPVLSDWIYFKNYFAERITAAQFSNQLSNLRKSGDYYVSGTEASNFTDLPTTAGSFIKITSLSPAPSSTDCIQEVTENNTSVESWKRQVSGGSAGAWVKYI